jgi:hypothetical protein
MIADAHFAQIAIEIGEHPVKQRLGETGGSLGVLEPPHDQERVQRDQFEAAVERIGHAPLFIEDGCARRRDDRGV